MEARLTGAKRGALDDVSDALNRSGEPATQRMIVTCDNHPCPVASRACPGQRHRSTPSEAAQLEKAHTTTFRQEVGQDVDATEADMDRTPDTVRARPAPSPGAMRLDSQPRLCAHAWPGPSGQAPQIMPSGVSSALRDRAARLAPTTDGVFDRTVGRPLARVITDGLLIEVQQAVDNTGDAAEPKLSGLARKRLMAWVVVDVLRSPLVLPRPAADKVGGRIWKQAQRVSAAVTAVADTATNERDAAHAAAAADPSLERGLAADLAAIDTTERLALDKLLTEVYTGFTELELVPPMPSVESVPPMPSVAFEVPTAAPAPPMPSGAAEPVPRCDGVRYEYLLSDTSDLEVPAVPPDLSASLNSDVLQMLAERNRTCMAGEDADKWWSFCLPSLACTLARQLSSARSDFSRTEALRKEAWDYAESLHVRHQDELAEVQADYAEIEAENSELLRENEELHRQLTISQAETAILAKVLGQKDM